MTKSTITRERLEELAAGQSGFNLRIATHEESQELARMALAAMEGEPVAKKVACWSCQNEVEISAIGDCDGCCPNCNSPIDLDEEPYAAPQPAPVVPDEREAFEAFVAKRFGDLVDQRRAKNGDHGYMAWDMVVAWIVWQARSAMLQAEPVTTANKLPPNSFADDELEGMAHGDNPQSNAYRELLAYRRNSPVIPDAWIPVSERMPAVGHKVLAYRPDAPKSDDPLIRVATYVGKSAHGHGFDCYCKPTHWMQLPAATQEVGDA